MIFFEGKTSDSNYIEHILGKKQKYKVKSSGGIQKNPFINIENRIFFLVKNGLVLPPSGKKRDKKIN